MSRVTVPKKMPMSLHDITFLSSVASGSDRPTTAIIKAMAVPSGMLLVRKRFDDEMIDLLLKFKWWDKSVEEIESLMPILSCGDLEKVKNDIRARL